jgi:serine/threonine protein kinase
LLTSEGIPKLADFGASALLSSSTRKRHTFIGTPYWMAPEVLTECEYDTAADIWSLGITLIELATGSPPHFEFKPMKVVFHVPRNPSPTLPDPSQFSPEFNAFIAACLVKDELARPSASELKKHPFISKYRDDSRKAIKSLIVSVLPLLKRYRRVLSASFSISDGQKFITFKNSGDTDDLPEELGRRTVKLASTGIVQEDKKVEVEPRSRPSLSDVDMMGIIRPKLKDESAFTRELLGLLLEMTWARKRCIHEILCSKEECNEVIDEFFKDHAKSDTLVERIQGESIIFEKIFQRAAKKTTSSSRRS